MGTLTSELSSVITFCRSYDRVLVTGSQRSGTTIAARMIASDLRWTFVEEGEVNVNDLGKARQLIENERHFVLQIPNLLLRMDEIREFLMERRVGVVAMRRPFQEVMASRKRINHPKRDPASQELKQDLIDRAKLIGAIFSDPEAFLSRDVPLMEFRQLYVQHYLICLPEVAVLDYRNLEGHPMWLQKSQRMNFAPKTTTLDGLRLGLTRNEKT